MSNERIEDLRRRLREADAQIEALRNGQVDAVVGQGGVSFLREREYEKKYRQTVGELTTANAELDAARRAAVNLMHDAVAAREESEQAFRALRANEQRLRQVVESLERSDARLRELNMDLERRVEVRTAELRLLGSRAASAQEEERRRIAMGLHDSVCQLLAACQLNVARAESCTHGTDRQGFLHAAERILKTANDEVRGLTFELSSTALFDAGLVATVRELCRFMKKRYGIAFELNGPGAEVVVPESPRPALYYCLRELMYNVVKHAGVDCASVRIEKGGGKKTAVVRITVRDNGKGFDPESLHRPLTWKGGLGLRQVRERMRDINGTLKIESVPGDGTKALLEVDLSRSRPGTKENHEQAIDKDSDSTGR